MKPITELYRIVEGALKDDISMVMRYAKRLMRNSSMDIDWDNTEKGVQEILNAYNNRPANIVTLDDDSSITITSTILKSDTTDSNGRVYSKEALENAIKEYMENEIPHKVFFGPYKGTEDGRLVEVKYNDMFGKEQTIDEEIKEQANWLANNFSTRNGYTSMEENLFKMGEFVKNRMLDKYNLKNE